MLLINVAIGDSLLSVLVTEREDSCWAGHGCAASLYTVMPIDRVGRITLKMYSDTITDYLLKIVFSNLIQVSQY